MINAEKAFDMLPHIANIYNVLDLQKYIKDNFKNNPDEKQAFEQGKKLMLYVVANSKKVKEDFFSIIAIINNCSYEDALKSNIASIINSLKSVFEDKELLNFFRQAI